MGVIFRVFCLTMVLFFMIIHRREDFLTLVWKTLITAFPSPFRGGGCFLVFHDPFTKPQTHWGNSWRLFPPFAIHHPQFPPPSLSFSFTILHMVFFFHLFTAAFPPHSFHTLIRCIALLLLLVLSTKKMGYKRTHGDTPLWKKKNFYVNSLSILHPLWSGYILSFRPIYHLSITIHHYSISPPTALFENSRRNSFITQLSPPQILPIPPTFFFLNVHQRPLPLTQLRRDSLPSPNLHLKNVDVLVQGR